MLSWLELASNQCLSLPIYHCPIPIYHCPILQGRIRFNNDGVKRIQFVLVEQYRIVEGGKAKNIYYLHIRIVISPIRMKLLYSNPSIQ